MRSLSGLYFILRIGLALSQFFHYKQGTRDAYAIGCGILLGCILMVALLKPYSNSYMNYLDTILLANYVLLWYMLSSGLVLSMALTKLLLTFPMAMFILGIILRKMSNTTINNRANKIYCYIRILQEILYQRAIKNGNHYYSRLFKNLLVTFVQITIRLLDM